MLSTEPTFGPVSTPTRCSVVTEELLDLQRYPQTFPNARRLSRNVTLFSGPPNSGKTHAAFEALSRASSGVYLAPLRLLALEARDRLASRGLKCSLQTGEETDTVPNARLLSSTVEMLNPAEQRDLAVIDEAQLLFDPNRGWAWTRAILGAAAPNVILICSPYAVDGLRALLRTAGEHCTVKVFERKQAVHHLACPVALSELGPQDAVVAFAKQDVLRLRQDIVQQGRTVSVIYGGMPPELRRLEARKFETGAAEVVVATDAIGLGLNLPIRRMLFATLRKFDGRAERSLTAAEVQQIAGRAGRFGLHPVGQAGVLQCAEPEAGRELARLCFTKPAAPPGFKAYVAPSLGHVRAQSEVLGHDHLAEALAEFARNASQSQYFAVMDIQPLLNLALQLDCFASALSLDVRFMYAHAPVDAREERLLMKLLTWARAHAGTGSAGAPLFALESNGFPTLEQVEQVLKECSLWLWLHQRVPEAYGYIDHVLAMREQALTQWQRLGLTT